MTSVKTAVLVTLIFDSRDAEQKSQKLFKLNLIAIGYYLSNFVNLVVLKVVLNKYIRLMTRPIEAVEGDGENEDFNESEPSQSEAGEAPKKRKKPKDIRPVSFVPVYLVTLLQAFE